MVNIWTLLSRAELLWPEREALVDGNRRFTYRELTLRVRRLAYQLANLGVGHGTVVSILAPNNLEFFETYFATAMLGAILNPINLRLSDSEIAQIVADAGSSTLIIHVSKSSVINEIGAASPTLEQIVFCGGDPAVLPSLLSFNYDALISLSDHGLTDAAATNATDIAQLYYTSGTTGQPKGVMLTHQNVITHALAAISELSISYQDTWLHAAPMFHLADAWAVFAITAAGGRHVILTTFDADKVLSLMRNEAISMTNLIPTMVTAVLSSPLLADATFPSLRVLLTGGSAIAPELVQKIVTVFACDYMQTYGMTETSPFLTVSRPTADTLGKFDTASLAIKSRTGRPFLGVELKVIRDDGTSIEKNDAEVGEIVVRGPTVTPGYWHQPGETERSFANNWFHTGDLAVMDSGGSIKIVDRKKDVILSGGETVYSIEVENVLCEHQAVHECAVVGVPDLFWGEAVTAAIVTKPGAEVEAAEIIQFAKSRIASFKAPKYVYFIASMPKTGSGKIYKQGVREHCLSEREKMTAASSMAGDKNGDRTMKQDAESDETQIGQICEHADSNEEPARTKEAVSDNSSAVEAQVTNLTLLEEEDKPDAVPAPAPKSQSKRNIDLPFSQRRPQS